MTEEKKKKIFGLRLKSLREAKNLSQRSIADILNITPASYLFYEQGKNTPSLFNLQK